MKLILVMPHHSDAVVFNLLFLTPPRLWGLFVGDTRELWCGLIINLDNKSTLKSVAKANTLLLNWSYISTHLLKILLHPGLAQYFCNTSLGWRMYGEPENEPKCCYCSKHFCLAAYAIRL